MLIKTDNMDGTVTISGKNSVKTFLILVGFFALMLFVFFSSYQKYIAAGDTHPIPQLFAFKGMVIGGLGAAAMIFLLLAKSWIMLNGGNRIVLSRDKLTRMRGAKKSWVSWKSLEMFGPAPNLPTILCAKISGTDVSDDLKGKKEFMVGMTSLKADALELMKELNGYCAKANNIDPKRAAEIETKTENQIEQNEKTRTANIKQRRARALWLCVFGFGGLIAVKIAEHIFNVDTRPFEQFAFFVVIIFALIASSIMAKK